MGQDNNVPPPHRKNPHQTNVRSHRTFSRAAGGKAAPGQSGSAQKPFSETLNGLVQQTQKRSQSLVSSFVEGKHGTSYDDRAREVAERQDDRGKPKNLGKKSRPATRQTKNTKSARGKEGSQETEEAKGKEAEQRVVSKHHPSKHSQDGEEGEGNGGQGAFAQHQGQKGFDLSKQQAAQKKAQATQHALFGLQTRAERVKGQSQDMQVPQKLPDAVLEQILQYCRIIIKADGDKEMAMKLREDIFRGMDIQIALIKGKIEATFKTDRPAIKRLFDREKKNLAKALAEKSIEVRKIDVILT